MRVDALLDLAARRLPPNANVLHVGGEGTPPASLSGRRIVTVRYEEALPFLEAHAAQPFDAAVAAFPATRVPLLRFLETLHGALVPGAPAIVCDLVWQTAPTPELLRAYAPPAGREKVRPVEGYEMQVEHAGFAVEARETLPRELAAWTPDQQAALKADERGAARVAAWVLRREA